MFDLSYLDLPIEVAAESPRLDMIVSRLKASGLRAYGAADPVDFDVSEPLLIDVRSLGPATLSRIARAREMGATRPLIVLAPEGATEAVTDALIVRRDRDLVQLRARLISLCRREAREAEFRIRQETTASFGLKAAAPDPDVAPQVLFLGDGGPGFLALQSALRTEEVAVTAALTMRTALDYLASGRFAAVLTDLTSTHDSAGTFSSRAWPDAVPPGLPVFALTDPDGTMSEAQLDLLALSADQIEASGKADVLAARIAATIRRYTAAAPRPPLVKPGSDLVDPATGFYRREFMESHLARQIALSVERNEALSILTMRIDDARKGAVSRLAAAVRPRLRDTDCPALMSADTLVVSMPMTTYRGGVRIAERLAACAVQQACDTDGCVSWRVVEKRAYHSVQTLLGAALSGPFIREYAA
ncbi:MAG: hypothetical protein KDA53_16610 [Hyphomonas sp.]|nr:hypothetical protein [Hyphomonas sp.]